MVSVHPALMCPTTEFWMVVRLADSTINEAKMKLAEMVEILNEPREALNLVYEGLLHVISFSFYDVDIPL